MPRSWRAGSRSSRGHLWPDHPRRLRRRASLRWRQRRSHGADSCFHDDRRDRALRSRPSLPTSPLRRAAARSALPCLARKRSCRPSITVWDRLRSQAPILGADRVPSACRRVRAFDPGAGHAHHNGMEMSRFAPFGGSCRSSSAALRQYLGSPAVKVALFDDHHGHMVWKIDYDRPPSRESCPPAAVGEILAMAMPGAWRGAALRKPSLARASMSG